MLKPCTFKMLINSINNSLAILKNNNIDIIDKENEDFRISKIFYNPIKDEVEFLTEERK
jgi:hypothetical protein